MQEPELQPIIADCMAIVACFVPFPLVLEILEPRVFDGEADMPARTAALQLLAQAIK